MTNSAMPYRGAWFRFDDYEIADGYIRAPRGSVLELYDPWEGFGEADGEKPYRELIALIDSLSVQPDRNEVYRLSMSDSSKVVSWCRKYGLLGVGLHEALALTLAPRWTRLTPEPDMLFPAATTFMRTSWGWDSYLNVRPKAGSYGVAIDLKDNLNLEGKPAELAQNELLNSPPPSVVLQRIGSQAIVQKSLAEGWAHYFPKVKADDADSFDYPMPASDEFWLLYDEPVSEFLVAAACLRDALDDISELTSESKEWEAPLRIDSLLAPITPVLARGETGAPQQLWVCKSLLSTLAMMAVEELTSGVQFRRCNVCNSMFASNSPKAAYCSIRCRNTAQKRAYRERLQKK